jgi:3'-phosphoadenosine 5'-phosphosulfate sulfotransferase (PAPS reductase)/FAD synthetase
MIRVLVPVSGGKDSQACLKLAVEKHGPEHVRGLFCDTQFEHPLTYAHIDKLRQMYGVEIVTVTGGSVLEKSIKYGRFPGSGSRHCTDELKIRETKIYLKKLAEEHGGFEVWYGMRSEESAEREARYAGKACDELYAPHEVMPSKYPQYLSKMGVMFRLCILDWTMHQVVNFVGYENLNPLYHSGFPRVGCFPCLASGDRWKEKAFNHDDFGREQYAKVIQVSKQISKSVWKREENEAQGCLPFRFAEQSKMLGFIWSVSRHR